jgi:hypothetical protein
MDSLQGKPDIVNVSESRFCCVCGNVVSKRKPMWKYPDGQYMCIQCKTRYGEECFGGVTYTIR